VPSTLPPLVLSLGEPAGIGPEITLKAWAALHADPDLRFLAVGPAALYRTQAKLLKLDVSVTEIEEPDEAADTFPDALPVLNAPLPAEVEPGALNPANAPAVLDSLEKACDLISAGKASGLVTNPIHKRALYEAGFTHPGHTEYLAERFGGTPLMMLSAPGLRTVPLTVHVPLAEVPARLSVDLILTGARAAAEALRADFGIAKPRIALAALNPHAGEEGTIGREEQEILLPAAEQLRAEGLALTGPHPADTLFHEAARTRYDLALCLYHDQALIPLKTIDFQTGVNTTLGLDIVRTSPDHGTALDIAGKGIADPSSLIAAIRQAAEIAATRARARR